MIDDILIHKILTDLANESPSRVELLNIPYYDNLQQTNEKLLVANLLYLDDHGLIDSNLTTSADGYYSFADSKITSKGLDFLREDGGLTEKLNTITIKFDATELRAIFEKKIHESALNPEQKQKLNLELEKLPAESIKHLTKKVLDLGTENLPALMLLIQSIAN